MTARPVAAALGVAFSAVALLWLAPGCGKSIRPRWGVLAPQPLMTIGGKIGVPVRLSEQDLGNVKRIDYRLADRTWSDSSPRRQSPHSVWYADLNGITGTQQLMVDVHLRDGSVRKIVQGYDVMAPERAPGPASLLVVAPHPDDAVLCCAGVIKTAVDRGARVTVAVVTNNDFWESGPKAWRRQRYARDIDGDKDVDEVDYGYVNVEESLAAMAYLGVPLERVHHLGYPEGTVSEMWKARGGAAQAPAQAPTLHESPYRLDELAAFRFSRTKKAPALVHGSVVEDLAAILREANPDVVFAPHPDDTHPTHWGTSYFVSEAMKQAAMPAKPLAAYLVHWGMLGDYPSAGIVYRAPKAGNTAQFVSPEIVPIHGLRASVKRQAMDIYASQFIISAEISTYLHQFAKDVEPFWVIWPLDLGPLEVTNPVIDGKPSPKVAQLALSPDAAADVSIEVTAAAPVTMWTQTESPRKAGDVQGYESIRRGSIPTPEQHLEKHEIAAPGGTVALRGAAGAEWLYLRAESAQPFTIRRAQ